MPPPEPLGTPAASATPRRRSRRLRGRLEPRQLADYQATISALDTEHGRDVGYTLGSVAATHRRISQALAQGTTPSDESLNVGRDGRGTYLRKNALSWPLLELEAPAPNWTLFDEVTALAERTMREQQPSSSHETLDRVPEHVRNALWLSVQSRLYHALQYLAFSPPAEVPSAAVEREALKFATAPPRQGTLAATKAALEYRPMLLHRRTTTRMLDWHDMLAALAADPACESCRGRDASLKRALAATTRRIESLYGSEPLEPALERNTWRLRRTTDVQQRLGLLKRARAARDAAVPHVADEWRDDALKEALACTGDVSESNTEDGLSASDESEGPSAEEAAHGPDGDAESEPSDAEDSMGSSTGSHARRGTGSNSRTGSESEENRERGEAASDVSAGTGPAEQARHGGANESTAPVSDQPPTASPTGLRLPPAPASPVIRTRGTKRAAPEVTAPFGPRRRKRPAPGKRAGTAQQGSASSSSKGRTGRTEHRRSAIVSGRHGF